jgi:hypothetical protein
VQIEVVNDAVAARIGLLRQMVERLHSDPEQTYLAEMERYISGRMSRASLGLARVTHEVGMAIDLQIDEPHVKVIARRTR